MILKTKKIEMTEAQYNMHSYFELFLFSICKVSDLNLFVQGVYSLFFMNEFLGLCIFSLLIKPVNKKAHFGHPCQTCSLVVAVLVSREMAC